MGWTMRDSNKAEVRKVYKVYNVYKAGGTIKNKIIRSALRDRCRVGALGRACLWWSPCALETRVCELVLVFLVGMIVS